VPPGEAGAGDREDLCRLLVRCARLEALGLARFAEPNHRRRLAGLPDDPFFPGQWALQQVGMPAAWEIAAGADLTVAVVDSGIRPHPDLLANLVQGYDFEDGDADPTDRTVGFSHGTQVAGVIGAAGNNAMGVAGVLWSVRIMPVRAFDSQGFGSTFDIANAIRYAAGLENSSGALPAEAARVINLSFASDSPTQVEEEACEAARAAGALLVAAAGNDGRARAQYPAAYPAVLAVAATGIDGKVTSYSNSGGWVDLAAPGGTGSQGVRVPGVDGAGQFTYPLVSGTSFSAPHVAGVAALLFGLRDMTPAEAEEVLLATAIDIGAPGRDDRSGAGIVDAYAAARAALDLEAPILHPFETVRVRLLAWPSLAVVREAATSETEAFDFGFGDVAAGEYVLEAGTDRNFDGILDGPGEVYGRWRDGGGGEVLAVVAGAARTDLDFAIAPR
jgi:serine protease